MTQVLMHLGITIAMAAIGIGALVQIWRDLVWGQAHAARLRAERRRELLRACRSVESRSLGDISYDQAGPEPLVVGAAAAKVARPRPVDWSRAELLTAA